MERIHVTVRARPLSLEDAKTSPWKISGNSVFIPNHSTKFEFDRVFGEDCKTLDVYTSRTKDIVAAAVRGFNGTVFAYGQTSSGKTHTMRGSDSEPGVIPLAVHDLFDTIQEEVDREFLLRMSYMEIYNEDVNDLLAPEHRKLQIHESVERGIFVAGLREEIVASPQQVLDLMQFGESHRHIGQTNMNLYSSRSHTIFRMIIESRDRSEDGSSCDAVRVSVLNLVDLAGSERAAKTGAEGVRLKEGSHINKSLMTLGTVIKKLSEGADIQGGHVPYRDSKLTRILQPALGGNANTAIICNITLAQIHADETKSSLQFASRALRVTNCATVNEILTDAALLKRQKKEIEELRAKLQGSHSEHLEEEILTLRNTLLQSELERERITLELEEEKRSQAERERILKEQAKKIENLSSMVLYSNRDETRNQYKKGKRRDTWCPSNISREALQKVDANIQSRRSEFESMETSREVGPLLPFETLVSELQDPDEFSKKLNVCKNSVSEDLPLPDPCSLHHVTNRRKVPSKKKGSSLEENKVSEMEAEYEELLLKLETQRTFSEVQIDCLRRQLVCSDVHHSTSNSHDYKIANHNDKNISLRESEAILIIKQLQEKITVLEAEKASSQQNLDNVVELATEQRVCASEKLEEISKELHDAQEDARIAHEQLASNFNKIDLELNFDAMTKPIMEIEEIMLEAQNTMTTVDSFTSLFDDVSQLFPDISNTLIDFKALVCQISQEQESIIMNHNKLYSCMRQKIENLEKEKLILYNESIDFQKQIQELSENVKKCEESLNLLPEEWSLEKAEYLSEIEILQGELLSLSSCSLAKEKESLRKDLEKTKVKLKDTDSKLKNVMQEKTKLEGEKAFAEREVKRLQSEKCLLERNISKCDSLIGRRNEPVVKKSSKCLDTKKDMDLAASYEQMQEDYRNLEVLAFEMEEKIASLEEELLAAQQGREEAISRNKSLALEIEAMSEKMRETNAELCGMQEEISTLRLQLEEATFNQEKMGSSIKLLGEEKELLAMQLSDSLLEMEEEKAVWLAKEKASIEAIDEKSKSYNSEIASLSKVLLEVRNELECQKKECEDLKEVLTLREENSESKKKCSLCQSLNTDQDLETADLKTNSPHESLESDVEMLSSELCIAHSKSENVGELESPSSKLQKDFQLSEAKLQIEELKENISNMEVQIKKDGLKNDKDKAKDRMRLRGMQARLDAYRLRYTEQGNEMDIMNRKYEEASRKLKGKLATYGIEVLNLKKQLSNCRCHGESSK